MRPMTETRKRRLSDPQLLANKRLTNGFSKTDHVTTRSQAKNDPISRVSPSRKVKLKTLTTEERRLMISMRLRHEETRTTRAGLSNPEDGKRMRQKSSTHFLTSNGRTNGLSSIKSSVRTKLRTRVLGSINEHQHEMTESVNSTHKKRATEVKNREIRAKKRRSALWVLNCEAEEFLFGETAAEDQEFELPPISPPPKKRRRMRATELGELLKETPLLESKLRQTAPGSSELDTSQVGEKARRGSRTKTSSRVQIETEDEFNLEEDNCGELDGDDEDSNLEFPNYSLMLEAAATAATTYSSCPTLLDSSASDQSVRIKRILNSIDYTFSFENVPSSEVWYRTFCYQNRPRHTFHMTTESLVILPYEAKGLNRELEKRLRRPPRKSPRCHASTQAILSALKPTRTGRVSGNGLPPPAPTPLSVLSSSSKSKPITVASHIQETPVSSSVIPPTGSQSLFSCSKPPVTNPQPQVSLIAPNAIQNGIKACDMTATQYLWDSVQFLSDPYVIHVLSQSDIRICKGIHVNRNSSTESGPENYTNSKRISHVYVNHNNNVKSPLKLIIPSPKTSPSPRFNVSATSPTHSQNGTCTKLELRRILRSPPASPANFSGSIQSPLLHSPSGSGVCSGSSVRKSPRKGSGLIVSAEATIHLNKNSSYNSLKFKSALPKLSSFPVMSTAAPDEALFAVDNTLPDFPWDTLN